MIYSGGDWEWIVVMQSWEKIEDYIAEVESMGGEHTDTYCNRAHFYFSCDDDGWWGAPGEDSVGVKKLRNGERSSFLQYEDAADMIADGTLVPIMGDVLEVE